MTATEYRVTVRGKFDGLSDSARARLLAEVDAHDLLAAAFTEVGTFTYDRTLLAFTFRYAVTVPDVPDEKRALATARGRAVESLEDQACGYRDLDLSATNMNDIPIRRKHQNRS